MKGSFFLLSCALIGSSDKGGFEELREIIDLSVSLILLESGDRNNLLSLPSPISLIKQELMDLEGNLVQLSDWETTLCLFDKGDSRQIIFVSL